MQVKPDSGKNQGEDNEHSYHYPPAYSRDFQFFDPFIGMNLQSGKERHYHQEIKQDDAVSENVHVFARKTFICSKAVTGPCEKDQKKKLNNDCINK